MVLNKNITKTLLIAQFIVIFLFFINENQVLAYSRFVLGFLIYIFTFQSLNKKENNIAYMTMLVVMFFLGIISSIYNGNLGVISYIYSLVAYGGTAIGLLVSPLSVKTSQVIYYLVSLYFFFHMLVGTETNEVLFYSRNFISIVLVIFIGLVFISHNHEGTNVGYTPIFTGLIISLWSTGRSGVITFLLLFILKFFFDAFYMKGKITERKWLFIFITTLLITLFIIIPNRESLFSRFYLMDINDEPRLVMWFDYFNLALSDFFNFILGVEIQNIELISVHHHLHNSILTLHARYGLIVLLFILSSLAVNLVFLIRNGSYDLAIFMITFMVRSLSDNVLNGDILLLYFTFYPLYSTMSHYNHRTYENLRFFKVI